MPNAFTKHAAASALVSASDRAAQRKVQPHEPGRRREAEQQRLKRQPLAHEAVQERQAGDGHRADEEAGARPRHAAQQPAEPLELTRARRHDDAPRAEEQQPLEDGVVQHVREAGRERDGRQAGMPVGERHHAGAQAEEDDAGVLDRAVGEQALQIGLRQRVQDAEDRGERADEHEGEAPAGARHAQAERADAKETVDARRDEHGGHQRRDAGRRRRMRLGQPDVERQHARLDAEADEEQHEQHVAREPRDEVARQQRGQRQRSRGRTEDEEAGQQAAGADVRHHEVEIGRAAAVAVLVVGRDERRRRQRHQLPGEQKRDRVAGREHQLHGAEHHVERRRRRSPSATPGRRARNSRRCTRPREPRRRRAPSETTPRAARPPSRARSPTPRVERARRRPIVRSEARRSRRPRSGSRPRPNRRARRSGTRTPGARARASRRSSRGGSRSRWARRRRSVRRDSRRHLPGTHHPRHQTSRTSQTTSAITYARYACRLPACSTFRPFATRSTVRRSGS